MHRIRSETLGKTLSEILGEIFRAEESPRVLSRFSDRILCMTLGETLSETRFSTRDHILSAIHNFWTFSSPSWSAIWKPSSIYRASFASSYFCIAVHHFEVLDFNLELVISDPRKLKVPNLEKIFLTASRKTHIFFKKTLICICNYLLISNICFLQFFF